MENSITLFSVLLNTSLKGCCFIALSILIYSLGKRLSPKLKYIVLFSAILSFVFVPFVSQFLNVAVSFFSSGVEATESYVISYPVIDTLQRGLIEIPFATDVSTFLTSNQTVGGEINWIGWFLFIWGIGFAVILLRILVGKWGLWHINRNAPSGDQRLENYLLRIKNAMGIKKRIRLVFSNAYYQPATYSWLRPSLLLPLKTKRWPFKQLKPVLIHELTHIKQGDCLLRDMARIICALFWFVPVIWIAYNKMKEEQEKSCDINVVNFGAKPVDYARQLLFMAKDSVMRNLFNFAMVPMLPKKILKGRIEFILKIKDYLHTKFSHKNLLIFSLCSLTLFVPISFVNPFSVESDIEKLARIKDSLFLEKATDLASLPYEIKSSLHTLPVIWPVLEGDGDFQLGDFIDNAKSVRISLGRWDYGVVVAVADGYVNSFQDLGNQIYQLVIEHKNNIYSIYSPLTMCKKLTIGEKVNQGDIVGYFYMDKLNNSVYRGYTDCGHWNYYLNFGLQIKSDYIDPLKFLLTFNKRVFIKY